MEMVSFVGVIIVRMGEVVDGQTDKTDLLLSSSAWAIYTLEFILKDSVRALLCPALKMFFHCPLDHVVSNSLQPQCAVVSYPVPSIPGLKSS